MGLTAIFGGTFNPLHIGHYEMLTALQNDSRVEKIFIMPDRIPPHKVCDFLADDACRTEMCRIASEDFSKAELCLIEFEREGKSYSYDTVLRLKELYPDRNFAFVCGGDMLVTFEGWYKYDELLRLLPFIVFKRSDVAEELFCKSAQRLAAKGMNIIIMEDTIPSVSSTEIRNDFSLAKKYLPERIYKYLSDRGVYIE